MSLPSLPGSVAMLAAALLLTGCETTDRDLGHAVRQNRSAQIVDERPVYAGVPAEGTDGVRLADAQRRYLAGRVKELLKVDGRAGLGAQGGATENAMGASGRTAAP